MGWAAQDAARHSGQQPMAWAVPARTVLGHGALAGGTARPICQTRARPGRTIMGSFFFGTPAKGAGTQDRGRRAIHVGSFG